MPRAIWVFVGRTLILLVLSCRGSYICVKTIKISLLSCLIMLKILTMYVLIEQSHEKTYLWHMNKKGADQPVLPRSLISSLVVHCFDSCYNITFKILASFCSWAGRFEFYLVTNPEGRVSYDVAHSICRCEPEDEDCEEVCVEYDKYILNVTDYIATLHLLQHRNIPIHFIIGPGSVKMDLKGINVKIEVFKQNERIGVDVYFQKIWRGYLY